MSRQHDLSLAVVLFGDRVRPGDLRLKPATLPLPLTSGAGLDLVCRAADTAGITVTGLARGGIA